MIDLTIGFVAGVFMGVCVAALMHAAKDEDEWEKMIAERVKEQEEAYACRCYIKLDDSKFGKLHDEHCYKHVAGGD